MKEKSKDLLLIHMAVMLFGLTGVIGRSLTLPSVIITFGRLLSSAVFLAILLKSRKEKLRIENHKDIALFLIAGIVLAVHWTAFIQSVQVSSVAIGTISFSTFPLFVTFLEPYFFKEKLRVRSIIEAMIMLTGVLIMVPGFTLGNEITQGILWGMGSSLTFAMLSLINRKLTSDYSGSKISFYEQSIATIVMIPSIFLVSYHLTGKDVIILIIFGVLCTAIAHSLFVSGLKKIRVQTAGIISGMESVYGILLAVIFLREFPDIRECIGGALILVVTIYSTLTNDKAVKRTVLENKK